MVLMKEYDVLPRDKLTALILCKNAAPAFGRRTGTIYLERCDVTRMFRNNRQYFECYFRFNEVSNHHDPEALEYASFAEIADAQPIHAPPPLSQSEPEPRKINFREFF